MSVLAELLVPAARLVTLSLGRTLRPSRIAGDTGSLNEALPIGEQWISVQPDTVLRVENRVVLIRRG